LIRNHLKKDSNCIDIGANLGHILMEIVAAAPKGKHYAFEPIPDHVQFAKEKNFLKIQRCIILHFPQKRAPPLLIIILEDPL
jgi:precorrin-6B methylase 2